MRHFSRRLFNIILLSISVLMCACTTTTTTKSHPPALDESFTSAESKLSNLSVAELLSQGNAYLAAGKPKLARVYFLAAVSRDPEEFEAYLKLGEIDTQLGNYPSALTAYRRAGELDAQNLDALLGQVQTLRQQGEVAELGGLLNRAMEIAPNDPRVLTELAISYNLQGQVPLATPLFAEAAQNAGDQAAAYNNLGVNQISKGDYQAAVTSLKLARQSNPTSAQISNNLATALALAGEENQALALYRKTVGEAAAWNNLGYLYMTQGKFDDAERALHKALDANPKFYGKAKENLDRLQHLRSATPAK